VITDDADDGEKQVVRTYNFTAQYNGTGGSGTDTTRPSASCTTARPSEAVVGYAKAQFDLARLVGEGKLRTSYRSLLESLAGQGDPEAAAELADQPELPPLGAHLWGYFIEIAATRSSGGMGPSRLSRVEIRTWEADEGVELEPWERRTILAIDSAYLASLADDHTGEEGS
jgi:hypothetical protein